MYLSKSIIIVCLVSVVKCGKFESFILNVEEITDINKQCKQTVIEQQQSVKNLTDEITELKAKNAEYEQTMAAINSSLSNCNCQNSKSACLYFRSIN